MPDTTVIPLSSPESELIQISGPDDDGLFSITVVDDERAVRVRMTVGEAAALATFIMGFFDE
jgi:hypothetical protein